MSDVANATLTTLQIASTLISTPIPTTTTTMTLASSLLELASTTALETSEVLASTAVEYGWNDWLLWILFWFIKILLWLLAAALFGLWWCQGYILYLPQYQGRTGEKRQVKFNLHGMRSPSEIRLPFEEHYITTKDNVKIHSWLIKQDNDVCPTIIYFHGNAGNIGFCLANAKQLFFSTGCNILMVEYRGYGNSAGTPSEKGLQLDAQAALDFLRNRADIDPKKIFVFGRSLGGSVAFYLAHQNQDKICGVIVENTFTSIDDMVIVLIHRFGFERGFWFYRWFLFFYLTSHWNNRKMMSSLRVPALFISGLNDELIPPAHMRELHDSATSSTYRQFLGVEGGEHNDTYMHGGAQYYEHISNFISHLIT